MRLARTLHMHEQIHQDIGVVWTKYGKTHVELGYGSRTGFRISNGEPLFILCSEVRPAISSFSTRPNLRTRLKGYAYIHRLPLDFHFVISHLYKNIKKVTPQRPTRRSLRRRFKLHTCDTAIYRKLPPCLISL